ncbi:MAG TPA: imidazole glycerol phosphate synthase subunit HisF [Clostridiaceae bacterium]|nr:imidazole glycerol phosphate synthase subunit HisF [Clostridiaceae bacterium]
MSTYIRIIPCLDMKDGKVVKGVNFTNIKDAGDPVEIAKVYCQEGADELVLLDISATVEGRKTLLDVVSKVAKEVKIPFIVGGGIGSIEDIYNVLNAGANKVSINSAAVKNPLLIKEASKQFSDNCIIVAIDAARNNERNGWDVYINGGNTNTGKDVIDWAKEVESLGAGEILLTSKDRDGTKNGYDIELTKAVAESVSIPVIASGGAGSLKDFYDVITEGKAQAVLAASLFHFKEIEIGELKKYLKEKGVQVKL